MLVEESRLTPDHGARRACVREALPQGSKDFRAEKLQSKGWVAGGKFPKIDDFVYGPIG